MRAHEFYEQFFDIKRSAVAAKLFAERKAAEAEYRFWQPFAGYYTLFGVFRGEEFLKEGVVFNFNDIFNRP